MTILWPPFVGWMFFCSLLFRILSRTRVPTLVIVSNEPTQWWAGMDCACAIENMFLAAHSLGIGSCWINQLGTTCDDPEVRAFITSLGVPENHKVYGCVALGYADSKIPMKEKKVKDGTITIVK